MIKLSNELLGRAGLLLLLALLVTLANVMITKHLMDNQLKLVVEAIKVPQIYSIDMQNRIESLIDEGYTPEQVMAYSANLATATRHQGVILIDAQSIVSAPDTLKAPNVSVAQVEAYLTQNNLTLAKPAQFTEQLKAKEQEILKLLQPAQ